MDIFEHFSCYTRLPVKINDVRDHVLEQSDTDVIEFHGADIPPGQVFGFLHHFKQGGKKIAHIIYARSLDLDMKRLVCCKELIHILDDDKTTAQSVNAVSRLISQISVPLYLQPAAQTAKSSNSVISDYMGELLALAVLLPRESRKLLKPRYDVGDISSEEIAATARIPEPWVRYAMSDQWGQMLEDVDNQK